MGVSAKPEIQPEFKIALFAGFGLVFFGLVFGGFAVLWQDNHGFAGEHAVLLGASHVFLIFGGLEVFLLELEGFDFDFEAHFFDLALAEALLQSPVAVECANRATSPPDEKNQQNHHREVRKSQQLGLELVAELAEFNFELLHAYIIPLAVCPPAPCVIL